MNMALSMDDVVNACHFGEDVFGYGFYDEAPRYDVAKRGSYGFSYRTMLPFNLKNLYATGNHAHATGILYGARSGGGATLCAKTNLDTR